MGVRELLLVCSLFGGGCQRVFPYEAGRSAQQSDAAFDVGVDPDQTIPEDVPAPDQSAPAVRLSCTNLRQLDAGNLSLVEPAISPDGLELYALASNQDRQPYVASRTAADEAFESWKEAAGFPLETSDPSFFPYQGTPHMIASTRDPKPRHLVLYRLEADTWAAEGDLEILLGGLPIIQDVDGAKVFNVDGEPVLLLNTVDPIKKAEVLVARMQGSLLRWNARTITALSTDLNDDDPTIDPRGEVVVFGRFADGLAGDLYYALRQPGSDVEYSPPAPLQELNSVDDEYAPELWRDPATGKIELFFSSDREGEIFSIFQADCALE